jgi:hypothetical protein
MVASDSAKIEVDGDYKRVPLKCGCSISVYVPDSCPCFDREHYPELVSALEMVFKLAEKYRHE